MPCVFLQGNIVAILDSSKNVVVSYVYDAWGRPISKTGSMAATLGTVQPFRYRGYVYDEETGLYYLRSRYYNPTCCRFVNMDSVLLKGLLVSNQQAYCCNNPVLHTDSNGRNFWEDLWNLFCDTVYATQEIAQSNAQAEHEAYQAAGAAIGDIVSSGWDLFVDTVNENQRVAQMNAQAELEANRAIAKSLWNLFVMTVEENQKIAQVNAEADHYVNSYLLKKWLGIDEYVSMGYTVANRGTQLVAFVMKKQLPKGLSKFLGGWGLLLDVLSVIVFFIPDD